MTGVILYLAYTYCELTYSLTWLTYSLVFLCFFPSFPIYNYKHPLKCVTNWKKTLNQVPSQSVSLRVHITYFIFVVERRRTLRWLFNISSVTLQGICEGKDSQEQALLPEVETIIHFCQSQVFHSPTTFLKSYTKPVNILMDTGKCYVIYSI